MPLTLSYSIVLGDAFNFQAVATGNSIISPEVQVLLNLKSNRMPSMQRIAHVKAIATLRQSGLVQFQQPLLVYTESERDGGDARTEYQAIWIDAPKNIVVTFIQSFEWASSFGFSGEYQDIQTFVDLEQKQETGPHIEYGTFVQILKSVGLVQLHEPMHIYVDGPDDEEPMYLCAWTSKA